VITDRLERLRAEMRGRELDAFVSIKLVNTYYLSGFTSLDTMRSTSYTRPIVVVVDHAGATLIVPGVDEEAAAKTSSIRDIRVYSDAPVRQAAWALVFERVREIGARRIGIEEDAATVEWLRAAERDLPGVTIESAADLVERLRLIKDEQEIGAVRRAAQLADAAMNASMAASRPDVVELAAETNGIVALREAAAPDGDAAMIDAIGGVLSGPRASMPHELSSGRTIGKGDIFWHVWLVSFRGYWAENVRTGAADQGSSLHEPVYQTVQEALLAGQETARPGARACDVYSSVMKTLKREKIPNGIVLTRSGHGSGLEYHEPPFMEESDQTLLEPGMVITVEPGVWMPGIGGATLSNTLVIRDGPPEVLTKTALALWQTGLA